MAEDTIESIVEFIQKLKGIDEIIIKYKKKDNTIRDMNITLNFEKIPKKDQPKDFDLTKILKLLNERKMIHVYDIEKKGWRAVIFNNIEYLKQGEKKFKIKKI